MARDLRRLSVCLIGAAVQLALAQSASAQQAAAGASSAGLEEIIVTAQRREEKLSNVPMTITVYNQEALDQKGIKAIDDLSRVSPGVTFIRNGMGSSGNYNDEDSDISIRGIQSAAGAATTGIYIDDTPIQTRHLNFGTVNPYPTLFDLERVEVLKGPQGTLFGAGSEGGTIRFITPQASLHDYQVYARAEYAGIDGGGSNYEGGLAVGGPIIDGVLGFRVSASYRENGGWVNRVAYNRPAKTVDPSGYPTTYSGTPTVANITEANSNWADTATFRAALKWQPTDNLTISPSVYAQTLHINDTGAYWINMSSPSQSIYNNGNAQRDPSTDPFYLAGLKAEWNLPTVLLTSNTSYFSRAQHSMSDYTQWFGVVFGGDQYLTGANAVSAYFTDRQDNFSEEIRVASKDQNAFFSWSAGLYYSHVHENSTEFIHNPTGVGGLLGPAGDPNGTIYFQPIFSAVDKQAAIFGETYFKFTDAFKLTVGLRASQIKSDFVVQESGKLVGVTVNSISSNTEKPVTPRVVGQYFFTPDNNVYASVAKGFRPGGANPALPPVCGAVPPPTFSSDSLWHYEVGTKNLLADRRVQLNAAAYYLQWKGIQQFVYLFCGLGYVPNLGEAEGRGGDIELNWRATDNLTLGATAAYTSTAYKSNQSLNGASIVTSADHLQASPWNINANLEYVLNSQTQKPYLRLDYQFATAQKSLTAYQDPGNAPNYDPTLPGLPEIKVLSVRAGVRAAGADVSLFIQNALNYSTPIFVSRDYPVAFNDNYFGRGLAPRTIGMSVTYKY